MNAGAVERRQFLAGLALWQAWTQTAFAMQESPYRIAYLALTPNEDQGFGRVFAERLRDMGLRQGENLELRFSLADGRPDRLRDLAARAVSGSPDILVAGFGTLAAKAAAAATTAIPVLFTCVGDPLGAGLVTNLGRPGGNVTGISAQVGDLGGKRLQLLRELAPAVTMVGVLLNPETPFSGLALQDILNHPVAGLEIVRLDVSSAEQIGPCFDAAVRRGIGALIVLEDPFTLHQRKQIVEAAQHHRLPAIYGIRDFVEAGGLASYGPDLRENFRRAADHYVESLRKGIKAGDLPVEQPTRFELLLNSGAAQRIGLQIPANTLAQGEDVIE